MGRGRRPGAAPRKPGTPDAVPPPEPARSPSVVPGTPVPTPAALPSATSAPAGTSNATATALVPAVAESAPPAASPTVPPSGAPPVLSSGVPAPLRGTGDSPAAHAEDAPASAAPPDPASPVALPAGEIAELIPAAREPLPAAPRPDRDPLVEIVIPVHNEEVDLGPNVRRLYAFLAGGFPYTFQITIADNASTDRTWDLARELAGQLPRVSAARLPAKGRGRALRATWSASRASVVAYMDVDLSTDLGALLPLVAPLVSGHSDLAIGSRLAPGARVIRGPRREVISRGYNLLLRAVLRVRFSDAQCGFKAARADVARRLLPYVEDGAWFFDTELLVLAERSGLRIHEVPVDWVDDLDSRVSILPTAVADLRGIGRLAAGLLTRRLPVRALRADFARSVSSGREAGDGARSASSSSSISGDRLMTTVPAADSGERPEATTTRPLSTAPTSVSSEPAARDRGLAPGDGGRIGWRGWPSRITRGQPGDPRWVRPALLALLAGTAVLYLWDLGATGSGNSFYAAAVQAGTLSWKAMFFGSLDASNYITVDKPPASLWMMALSGRIFGFSSWSLLVPDALCGVASVWVLYASVRRVAGPAAGLLAGLLCALTPVAALMFRFDNPDALLVLTMVLGGYFVTRAVERGSWRWLLLAGVAIGFGFLTKMLQAFLVLPAFALVYLIAAPPAFLRRVGHVLAGGVGVVLGAGWWVAIVQLWPSGSRPYVGGSRDDSELGLAFGYNGLGRIFGGDGNRGGGRPGRGAADALRDALTGGATSPGFPGGGARAGFGGGRGFGGFGGQTGIDRLFSGSFGAQISWLLPAALILLVGGLWVRSRAVPRATAVALAVPSGLPDASRLGPGEPAWSDDSAVAADSGGRPTYPPRTDLTRAGLLLWGGWLVGSGLVFSYMKGTIHEYYSIALAPSVGATVAIGAAALWRDRENLISRVLLAASFGVSGWWAYRLLGRIDWQSWLRMPVLIAGILAGALTLLAIWRPASEDVDAPTRQTPTAQTPSPRTPAQQIPAQQTSTPQPARWAGPSAGVLGGRARTTVATLGIAALAGIGLLGGPAAYAFDTAGTPHTGGSPLAGPSGRGGGASFAAAARALAGATDRIGGQGGLGGQFGGRGGGRFGGQGPVRGSERDGFGGQFGGGGEPAGGGAAPNGGTARGGGGFGGFDGGFGGFGGQGTTANAAITSLLQEGASGFRWVAAVSNSESAAALELATGGKPVMAIGGFSGTDPAITLARFEQDVASGKIHYYVGGGGFGGGRGGGGGVGSEISSWVRQHYAPVTTGGQTIYDLTKPTGGGTAA